MPTTKQQTPRLEIRSRAGDSFFTLNRRSKKGVYRVKPDTSQAKHCQRILVEGFDRLPSGFYRNDGFGLTGGGSYLLREVGSRFGKEIALTLVLAGTARLDTRGKAVRLRLPHDALSKLNTAVRAIKSVRNEETAATVRDFLGTHFRQFRDVKGARPSYAPGTLSQLLQAPSLIARLSTEDRSQLEAFIPGYLASIPGTLRAKNKLQVIYDTLDAGKKVYLKKILKEFRSKLGRRVQNEAIWQAFLSDYILVLRSSYSQRLEKTSISLRGKFPDFVLIDPYGYLDIFEIKKPTTVLLSHDASHDNFYWSVELSKAISQVENYLHQVQRIGDTLTNDIRQQTGLDINVVRPRGYIVAGMREQLTTTKKQNDFRILNESLKNIDVILYDDLLQHLQSFVEKIA